MANKNPLSVVENKNREFWISHMIVFAATVLGVYLAASAGLQAAVQFELIKSDRDSYYMRSALYDELQDNIDYMEKWGTEYRTGQAGKFIGKPKDWSLDKYVWTTMQDNTGTFEIPSVILTKIRRFYRDADKTLAKMTSRGSGAKQVDAFLIKAKVIRSETLVLLREDIDKLKSNLDSLGIKL